MKAMKLLRVYIDTSVFGGYFDDEFSVASRQFFDAVFAGQVIALVSETLAAELVRAPEHVQDLLSRTIQARSERLILTSEAIALRDAYLKGEVVTQKYADDALHVAQATLARADVIVSWNFRHLVNPSRIREFNGINLSQGYGLIIVMTPAELVNVVEVATDEPENNG
jgi:predicted nucleic acid-binding protein